MLVVPSREARHLRMFIVIDSVRMHREHSFESAVFRNSPLLQSPHVLQATNSMHACT